MKRLLLLAGITTTALVLLMIGARVVGSQATPPALVTFQADQCSPQPCWHAIRPGQITIKQAQTIFQSDSRFTFNTQDDTWCWHTAPGICWKILLHGWIRDPNSTLGLVSIHPAQDTFKLGDAIALFGDPLTSNLCWIAGTQDGDVPDSIPRPLAVAYLTFRGNLKVVAYNPQRPQARQLDPTMQVVKIYYQAGYDIYTPRWQGFVRPAHWGCNRG